MRVKLVFAILFFLCSCKSEKKAFYLERFHSNGKLKSKGWYIRDTIPIDTIFYFYENGNIEQIVPHNENGWKIGNVLNYDTNGIFWYTQKYFQHSDFGFIYRYKNDKVQVINMFYQNNTYGDEYGYDSLGKMEHYYFWDFRENARNIIIWENGKIKSKDQKIIYLDSIRIKKSDVKDNYVYETIVIISNPPHTRTTLDVSFFSNNNKVLEKVHIENKHFYHSIQESKHLSHIEYFAKQYDSLTKKETVHTGKTMLKKTFN